MTKHTINSKRRRLLFSLIRNSKKQKHSTSALFFNLKDIGVDYYSSDMSLRLNDLCIMGVLKKLNGHKPKTQSYALTTKGLNTKTQGQLETNTFLISLENKLRKKAKKLLAEQEIKQENKFLNENLGFVQCPPPPIQTNFFVRIKNFLLSNTTK